MSNVPSMTPTELGDLVRRVFRPGADDHNLIFLGDLPDQHVGDDPTWQVRRRIAADWARALAASDLGLDVELFFYRNVRANNADLPAAAWPVAPEGPIPHHADSLAATAAVPFEEIFERACLVVAPTLFSTTAPLKLRARQHGLRAATMPGFRPEMIPALRLDYGVIDRRVRKLAELLDRASGADFHFTVGDRDLSLHLDLRHRRGHASGGLVTTPGTAGNLPSGESYIVPYEGEHAGDPSRSRGLLPVQLGDEVVIYHIENNRAVEVSGGGPRAREEAELLEREPAYGNLAELGLGVLGDFGLEPIGSILLDEKLGLHIAFGRSDHFGGQVGAGDFSRPEAVVHIDRIYLPQVQPKVRARSVDLCFPDREPLPLLRDQTFQIEL